MELPRIRFPPPPLYNSLKQAKTMIEQPKLDGESLALVARLKDATHLMKQWMKEDCASSKFDGTLRKFLDRE